MAYGTELPPKDKWKEAEMAESEKDYAAYAAKDPTDLHTHLAEWIKDKSGYDPTKAKSKEEAYLKGVQLGALLRMDHQSSPENQQRRAALSRSSEAKAEPDAPAAAKKATKAAKKAAAVAKPAEETTAPAKKAARPASGKRRGPRPAAAGSADTTGTPAPF